jgi:dUTP pyrophosphatase
VQILLPVKRLTESAKLPVRGSEQAAGLDIFADETVYIYPGETKRIKTGIAIELPPGTVGLFMDRGSVSSRGLHIFAGVIDADYRGELEVVLHNANQIAHIAERSQDRLVHIRAGDKITQLVILPYIHMTAYEVQQLNDTERGEGRFGSTGDK